MGGKSRKTGKISKKLIDRLKNSGGIKPKKKPEPKKSDDGFGLELDE